MIISAFLAKIYQKTHKSTFSEIGGEKSIWTAAERIGNVTNVEFGRPISLITVVKKNLRF